MQNEMNENSRLFFVFLREGNKGDITAFEDALRVIKEIEHDGMSVIRDYKERFVSRQYDEDNFRTAHEYSQMLREYLAQADTDNDKDGQKILRLYRDTLLFDAPFDFDCFCRYIEWDREEGKKFYMPRRKQLLPLARALQRLEERKIHLLCISMPPGVGKTTLAEFFLAWTGGKHPELPFEFSSIGSGNAGKIRAANLLYCDDLIDGIETAMNRDRLDKVWQQYTVDYRQRKIGDCAELHIATRWSVHDVIGNLEDKYGNDPDAEFIVCPALNEQDESNFDYPYGVGFTTEFYREQREIMDSVSWKCLYEQTPVEREGQLYPPDQLQRYFELPEGEPDAIIGVCDTKTTGSDFCSMPIAFQYGNKFYIEDVLFENYAPNIVEINLVSKICQWNPHMIRFESNVAGGKLASDIQQAVREKDCRTKIETKWTQANKETKILMESHWVLEHCIFKDESVLHGDEWREYRKFLQSLCSYSLEGKNKHDDAPDSMAQLSQYVQSFSGNKIQIVRRMF